MDEYAVMASTMIFPAVSLVRKCSRLSEEQVDPLMGRTCTLLMRR